MSTVGDESHQQETATSDWRHHQKRRGCLGKVAQTCEGDTEDGREHDGLEHIVAKQGYQRQLTQI